MVYPCPLAGGLQAGDLAVALVGKVRTPVTLHQDRVSVGAVEEEVEQEEWEEDPSLIINPQCKNDGGNKLNRGM